MTSSSVSPVIDEPKRLILEMAQARSLDSLLSMVVRRLAASPKVALARIWLRLPAEGCPSCALREECPEKVECLHLVASFGNSLASSEESYARLDGQFRRFPIGVRKVGRIAHNAAPIEVPDISEEPGWIAVPEWAREEEIQAFGGQPLIYRGEVLGVLALFSRIRFTPSCLEWLRMIADHAASAIANARAWDEIEALREQLEQENEYLREEVHASQAFGDLVGQSPPMRSLAKQIELVAPTEATVLITGESGTGKELVAREIHRRSQRAHRPLIRVNCAAVPRELYESEFFGHVRGAFTGAVKDRVGRFELAHGGTIFLDEVGEIPLDLQSKLLRVLQENDFERVGDERTRQVDVRVIAATNRDLREASEKGQFRKDLYYRLSVFPIETVPLRDRIEDIPLLAEHFLRLLGPRVGRQAPALNQANVQHLQRHGWPGNVRELQHVLEHALIVSQKGRLNLEHLSPSGRKQDLVQAPRAPRASFSGNDFMTESELREMEKRNLERVLAYTGGKVHGAEGAAALLGIKATTLASRIKALKIERK